MRVCALILKIAINTMPLHERRFDTVANFAFELDVSKHTIVRDVQILALEYPIFTKSGRYGGVYIMDGSHLRQRQLTPCQRELLLEIGKQLPEEAVLRIRSTIAGFSP